VCVMVQLVAVTVTVELPAGVPGSDPPPPLLLPPIVIRKAKANDLPATALQGKALGLESVESSRMGADARAYISPAYDQTDKVAPKIKKRPKTLASPGTPEQPSPEVCSHAEYDSAFRM